MVRRKLEVKRRVLTSKVPAVRPETNDYPVPFRYDIDPGMLQSRRRGYVREIERKNKSGEEILVTSPDSFSCNERAQKAKSSGTTRLCA